MITFRSKSKFNATSAGTGNFVVASAVAPFVTPQNANAISGHTYVYYAESVDGTQWENGSGVWTLGSATLTRVTVDRNSEDTTAKINFLTVPQVDIFPAPVSLEPDPPFPAGTLMLFQQSVAPVGWTKQTAHNDKALRVVSGTASSGGSNAFSTVMAQTVVGSHTLSLAEIPSHAHSINSEITGGGGTSTLQEKADGITGGSPLHNTGAAGSGGSHNHSIIMAMQYVDIIIASKDAVS